jgi:hypothetical protein
MMGDGGRGERVQGGDDEAFLGLANSLSPFLFSGFEKASRSKSSKGKRCTSKSSHSSTVK